MTDFNGNPLGSNLAKLQQYLCSTWAVKEFFDATDWNYSSGNQGQENEQVLLCIHI